MPNTMSDFKIVQFDPKTHVSLFDDILDLHVQCIEHDGALLRFHPPFDDSKRAKMAAFWRPRLLRVEEGASVCFLAVRDGSPGKLELCGMVELGMPDAETGPFRGDVELLMVSPKHRRQGLGNLLMQDLEEEAKRRGRTLLVTDPATKAHIYVEPLNPGNY
jgi:ribosomal protein S18 acetylase RimI-like enzyme